MKGLKDFEERTIPFAAQLPEKALELKWSLQLEQRH